MMPAPDLMSSASWYAVGVGLFKRREKPVKQIVKFSEIAVNEVFESEILNGLGQCIGVEYMRKITPDHAVLVTTAWDIPSTDVRRRVSSSQPGDLVKMRVGDFDPFVGYEKGEPKHD